MTGQEMLCAALAYARAGMAEFTLASPAARNRTSPRGFKDATTDQGSIRVMVAAVPGRATFP